MKNTFSHLFKLFAFIGLSLNCQILVAEALTYGTKVKFIASNDTEKRTIFSLEPEKVDFGKNDTDASLWVIIDPINENSRQVVNYNKPVCFKNVTHSWFLKMSDEGAITALQKKPDSENGQWMIVNAQNSLQDGPVNSTAKIAVQSLFNHKYVQWTWEKKETYQKIQNKETLIADGRKLIETKESSGIKASKGLSQESAPTLDTMHPRNRIPKEINTTKQNGVLWLITIA